MDKLPYLFAIFCLLFSISAIFLNRRKTDRILSSVEDMLNDAMDGSFSEKSISETRLSALETHFADFLEASLVSKSALAAERDKIRTLIADISHQTKTPISNLLLHSELLAEEGLPPSARDSADTIRQQSEKLRFLIDSLVKLSRLENGILTLSPHPSPLQPLLEHTVSQFIPKAEEKGLKLFLSPTEANAVFDPKWTGEALANLVDNAVKYTDSGSISLSVSEYDLFVRIDVADTGIGVSEAEQANIFSRFYRSERVRTREGVGIGLYLAREIVSGEGGYMKVSSQPGKGSVFSIFLPVSQSLQNC